MTNRAPEQAAGQPGQSERPERRAKGPRPSAIPVFMYAAGTVIAIGLLLAFPEAALRLHETVARPPVKGAHGKTARAVTAIGKASPTKSR